MRCAEWLDSSRWSAERLHEGAGIPAPSDGAGAPSVSFDSDRDRLFDSVFAVRAMGQRAVGFQNQAQGFLQIPFGFGQGPALRVDAWDLLDIGDVPFAALGIDCRELTNHRTRSIPETPEPVKHDAQGRKTVPGTKGTGKPEAFQIVPPSAEKNRGVRHLCHTKCLTPGDQTAGRRAGMENVVTN